MIIFSILPPFRDLFFVHTKRTLVVLIMCHNFSRVLVDSRLRDGFARPVSVADLEGWTKTDRWKANFAAEDIFEGSFDLTVPAGDTNATRTVSYTWKKVNI